MKKNLFTILAVFCVFGLGLVTTVGTGADDVVDALGIDRTVDFDENVDVELPAVTVEGTAPVSEMPMRMVADIIDETNCTAAPTNVSAILAGIDIGAIIGEGGFILDAVTGADVNDISIDYTTTWLPDTEPAPTTLTCSFDLTGAGTLGDISIGPFALTVASGTLTSAQLGITAGDITTFESYFNITNWGEDFTYCATCGYDSDAWDIDSYEVEIIVKVNADVTGSGTVTLE